jgi:hypothetical protein
LKNKQLSSLSKKYNYLITPVNKYSKNRDGSFCLIRTAPYIIFILYILLTESGLYSIQPAAVASDAAALVVCLNNK